MIAQSRSRNWLDLIRRPLALVAGLALLVAGAFAVVAGEFSVASRLALAAAILFFGMYVAIDPQKAFGALTSRESIYSGNAVALSVAFVGILVVLNILAQRFHQRWDLTAQRDFSLSEATLKILTDLPQPVHAMAFFSGGLSDRQKAEDLLKEYEARSTGRLTWEAVDTNAQPAMSRLYSVNVDGTIQFRLGAEGQSPGLCQAPTCSSTITSDEAHMTTALIKLVNPEPLKVYHLTGHGERDLEKFDDDGYSELKTQIQADNFVMEPLNLLAARKIPDDARAVIIAAPRTPLVDEELNAIKEYLDGKGRILLLVDAFQTESNAEEIIKRWDVAIGKGVAVDPVSSLPQSPLDILVVRYGFHPIVKSLEGERSLFPFGTAIEIPNFIKKSVEISGLALTFDARSWLETDRSRLQFDDGVDKKGPLTLAVAIEEAESAPIEDLPPGFQDPNKRVKNRVVVIGTSELAVNGLIKLPVANRDFVLNALNWITQTDQLITTRPTIAEKRTVFLTPTENNFVFFSSAVFFPLIILGIGGVVWWNRR